MLNQEEGNCKVLPANIRTAMVSPIASEAQRSQHTFTGHGNQNRRVSLLGAPRAIPAWRYSGATERSAASELATTKE